MKVINPQLLHVDPAWGPQDISARASEIYHHFVAEHPDQVLWVSRNEPAPSQVDSIPELPESSIIISGELSLMIELVEVIKAETARPIFTATTALVQSSVKKEDGSVVTQRTFNHVRWREI